MDTAEVRGIRCPRCEQETARISESYRHGVLADVIVSCDECDRPPQEHV